MRSLYIFPFFYVLPNFFANLSTFAFFVRSFHRLQSSFYNFNAQAEREADSDEEEHGTAMKQSMMIESKLWHPGWFKKTPCLILVSSCIYRCVC